MTVLVAENGSGKTAVLDAAGAALSLLVNALYPSPEKVQRIERSDLLLTTGQERKMAPCLPTQYEAQATVQDGDVSRKSAVRTLAKKVSPNWQYLVPK